MSALVDSPLFLSAAAFCLLALAAWVGVALRKLRKSLDEAVRDDFSLILGTTLTLLGLIIGFSFSMAISRYEQRKNFEEGEANAIGTAYLRADLLPAADGAKLRGLLRRYAEQRALFYVESDPAKLAETGNRTAQLQNDLWATVRGPALAQPTPVAALAVAAVNDVINAQGYTQAAWWNRIPGAAWALMALIAVCCNVLMGYGARKVKSELVLLTVLPLVVSVSFFLIADIDSPRSGIVRVIPQNLLSAAQSMSGP